MTRNSEQVVKCRSESDAPLMSLRPSEAEMRAMYNWNPVSIHNCGAFQETYGSQRKVICRTFDGTLHRFLRKNEWIGKEKRKKAVSLLVEVQKDLEVRRMRMSEWRWGEGKGRGWLISKEWLGGHQGWQQMGDVSFFKFNHYRCHLFNSSVTLIESSWVRQVFEQVHQSVHFSKLSQQLWSSNSSLPFPSLPLEETTHAQ